MKKIKYQGGLTKLLTSKIAFSNRDKFARLIDEDLTGFFEQINSNEVAKLDVVSFSSSKDIYEQILSIFSFVRYLGNPIRWTIYSDGSHSEGQILLLENNFKFVKVIKEDWNNFQNNNFIKERLKPYEDELLHFAINKPLGRKLFFYLNHSIENPTLFIDSDILFYEKAPVITNQLNCRYSGWFLPDASWGNLDSFFLNNNPSELYQVNSGFFIINRELSDLDAGMQYMKYLKCNYEYFTEQTVLHIILKSNNFFPLDPRIFSLNSGDQFDFSYLFDKSDIAIRHYTGPVRHKMWQRDWKWHLSL